MDIVSIRTLPGPNIYTHDPALFAEVDLEGVEEGDEPPEHLARLTALLPGAVRHAPIYGRLGPPAAPSRRPAPDAQLLAQVVVEFTHRAGFPAAYVSAFPAPLPRRHTVVIAYEAERATRFLLEQAVAFLNGLRRGESSFPVDEWIAEAQRLAGRTELGPSTQGIVDAARRRGIPYWRLNDYNLVQLGYGKQRKYIQAAMTSATSAVGMELAGDKAQTKALLKRAGIPTPYGLTATTETEAVRALKRIGAPVAVKPADGRQGRGVSLNLTTPEEVAEAFHIAAEHAPLVLVEEYYQGRDYRVLVVGGRVRAAAERRAAHVIGDGACTIRELIDLTNQDPRRGDGHEKPLTRIEIDPIMLALLKKMGRTLDDVPGEGETVFLRDGANLSTGGSAMDVTDQVHPEIARLCERAAAVLEMDICGIDLVLGNIAAPYVGSGGIIEINAAPGLRMHLHPSEGEARDVGGAIIEMLFPNGRDGRIPIIAVTGTNGKTTTTRMIGHAIGTTGRTVGMTTTGGIFIGGELIEKGDTTGPRSAQTVLFDPGVEVAVLETARGGLARGGLAYDWSDVAVITNIQADHIGQNGITSISDLVHIKSLVAERVREGGALILNADDDYGARVAEMPSVRAVPKRVVYFSCLPNHPRLNRHRLIGGTVYYLEHGWIVEAAGHEERRVVRAAAIPATLGGLARFHISNALAAVAACRAYGMPRRLVAEALATFGAAQENQGRSVLYKVGSGYVMLDYGHNPHAFEAVGEVAGFWKGGRVTGIVGVPGDRDDDLIEQAGRVAARSFGRLIIREDRDRRGRDPGEVPELLRRAVLAEVPECDCRLVLDEAEALRVAVAEMAPEELVVLFYEEFDPVNELLCELGAVPWAAPPEALLRTRERRTA